MDQDPENDLINAMFRNELEKFKNASLIVRQQVVNVIYDAGALDWLLEVCENDPDPDIQAYAQLAHKFKRDDSSS